MKQRNKGFASFLSAWAPRMIALILAFLIFAAVKYLNMTDRVITIPLSVTLPSAEIVVPESLVPSKTEIVISGNDELIYLVDATSITAEADFSQVTASGISRVPVKVSYNSDAFLDASLSVRANPDSVRILFREP